ncbi:coniferyl aldehyde dehydrogenase [Ningiella sp. W23]|uniref:coniferyl aldehyde dehydrogenase n=1 Tax=Ningiella sp. W23 TaxID=3023715 RepID=UPI0037569AB2
MSEHISKLKAQFLSFKRAFNINRFPSADERIARLMKLKKLIINNQEEIISSLSSDFGNRADEDTRIGDILTTVATINYCIKHLKKWMRRSKRHTSVLFFPSTAYVEYQPKGVVGIIVPWNYPLFLAFGPLANSMAAGNLNLIKMSEHTPIFASTIQRLLRESFPSDVVAVIDSFEGSGSEFSKLPFDHILFTGSTRVGRHVMEAASRNLTPVTLELGGKSPAIIAPDISIDTAVERFIFGKMINCGQTCVAPDYIFCPKGKSQELIDAIKTRISKMYPDLEASKDFTSIINQTEYERLSSLLNDAASKGAQVIKIENGQSGLGYKLPLTIVLDVNDEMRVMQDEIFGPILPIIEYSHIDEAVSYINAHHRPLALYIYTFDANTESNILLNTLSGGVCINDAAFHVAIDDLPFGGIGNSGMGNYHGEEGFKTFSHSRSVFKRGKISFLKYLFPPYGGRLQKMIFKTFIQ